MRYCLAAVAAPVAVADYYGLPADARAALPSAEEFQAVVDAELDHNQVRSAACPRWSSSCPRRPRRIGRLSMW